MALIKGRTVTNATGGCCVLEEKGACAAKRDERFNEQFSIYHFHTKYRKRKSARTVACLASPHNRENPTVILL